MGRLKGKNKRSYGVTVAIMSFNYFEEINDIIGDTIASYDKIAELASDFEEETKDYDWASALVDYETLLDRWTREHVSVLRNQNRVAQYPITESQAFNPDSLRDSATEAPPPYHSD